MKQNIFWQKDSIFSKISILTIIIILLTSIISTGAILRYTSSTIKDKDRLLVQEASSEIVTFTQDKYNLIYNQRTLLHSVGYISELIATTRKDPKELYSLNNVTKINEYLYALCYSDQTILDAIIFTADGANRFSYTPQSGRKVYLGYDYNTLSYIEDFKASKDTIATVYDPAPGYLTLSSTNDSAPVITYMAKIYDMTSPTKHVLLGYLMINYSPDTIDATYNDVEIASDGEYLVVNSQQKIIYTNHSEWMNQTYRDDLLADNEIILKKSISLSGLTVIGSISRRALADNTRHIIWQSILITMLAIFIMTTTIFWLHTHYAKRFHQLSAAMANISQGDFSTHLPIESQDEFGYLSESFNRMCDMLNLYIRNTYLAKTQQRTAELYALQAQINPHFLANTIESLRMKALADDNYELSEMLLTLGNLFRWMTQFHQDIIYIEDEVDYISSYLELQKFRFMDKLSVEMDIPPEVYYLGIPKFTLQPIVENAITHGISGLHKPLLISIRFLLEAETLVIQVEDNGLGIPEENVQKLSDHICGRADYDEFGVALRNVHTRIRLLFGDSYGLSVKSTYYLGTTITVTLPAKEKKELEKYV